MTWASCSLYSLLQRHPSPLSQLCILYIPPYFQKIYKFPPIFAQFRFFCWPYVSLLPTYFDHDAFMFHALHVLDSHALLHCWWEPYTSIFQMHLCSYFASLFNKSCLWVPTIYHICVPRAVCQCGMMLMIMVTAQFCLVHWPVLNLTLSNLTLSSNKLWQWATFGLVMRLWKPICIFFFPVGQQKARSGRVFLMFLFNIYDYIFSHFHRFLFSFKDYLVYTVISSYFPNIF